MIRRVWYVIRRVLYAARSVARDFVQAVVPRTHRCWYYEGDPEDGKPRFAVWRQWFGHIWRHDEVLVDPASVTPLDCICLPTLRNRWWRSSFAPPVSRGRCPLHPDHNPLGNEAYHPDLQPLMGGEAVARLE